MYAKLYTEQSKIQTELKHKKKLKIGLSYMSVGDIPIFFRKKYLDVILANFYSGQKGQ